MFGSWITRAVLFCAALLSGAEAGWLFYAERINPGAACLCMTGLFLWFAARPAVHEADEGDVQPAAAAVPEEAALFMAELALNSLKNIGRTVPPSTKEIEQLEDRVNDVLDDMGVPLGIRGALSDEFDKLKGRTRLNEGGRALIRSARL